jgi:hypothetical protein
VNHFRFFSPDFQKEIKDTWFEFDERSVKNYRIVDADSQARGAPAPPPNPPVLPGVTRIPSPAPSPGPKK